MSRTQLTVLLLVGTRETTPRRSEKTARLQASATMNQRNQRPQKKDETEKSSSQSIHLSQQVIRAAKQQQQRDNGPKHSSDAAAVSSVIIIGGGIGGFSLALALAQQGIKVQVFEKDPSFEARRQGYGFTIQQGCSALKHLGLLDKFVEMDTPSDSHYVFQENGEIVAFFGRAFFPREEGAPPVRVHNLHCPRQALREVLYRALDPSVIMWGKKLEAIHFSETHVQCIFHDGYSATADLVVGCDGIYSRVRQEIVPAPVAPLRYLGTVVVLGICEISHPLVVERIFQTLGGDTRIFTMPFTLTSTMWQLSFSVADASEARKLCADNKVMMGEILRRCGSWHAPVPEMLRCTKLVDIMSTLVYDRDPVKLHELEKPLNLWRATLLGDAAHPMSPFKGQGANQALLDGVSLAKHLNSRMYREGRRLGLVERIRAFEEEMYGRSTPKVMHSREAALRLHTDNDTSRQSTQRSIVLSRGLPENVLRALKDRRIGAFEGCTDFPKHLDQLVREVVAAQADSSEAKLAEQRRAEQKLHKQQEAKARQQEKQRKRQEQLKLHKQQRKEAALRKLKQVKDT